MQDLDRKSALLDILAKVKRWGVSTDQTEELASDIDALIEAESRPSFLDYDELNRYKSLVENNDLGIFSISRMHLSTVNQACVDILGFSEEELVSNGLDLFVYHEDLPKIGAMAQKVITGEIDSHYTEARFVHKNGSLRYFGVSLNAIRDSKGHYVESIGTFWDVTDKERAILALEESRNSFAVLYHNMFEAVVKYDYINDTFVDFNAATIDLFGYPEEEFKTMSRKDLIPQHVDLWEGVDMHAEIEKHRDKVIRGESFVSPGYFLRKNRSPIIADVSIIPQDPDAGIAYVIIKDKTKEYQQQEAIKASETKYRTVFENSPMAIISCDTDCSIKLASSSAQHMLSCDGALHDLVGTSIIDYIHEEDQKEFLDVFSEELGQTPTSIMSFRLVCGDQLRYVEGLTVPVRDDDGAIESIVTMFFDNTAKVNAQNQAKKFEAQYSRIFKFSPAPIINTNRNGLITLASPSTAEILGYSLAELKTMRLDDIVIGADWDTLNLAFAHYDQVGTSYRARYRCRTKNGDIRVLEGEGFPVKDEEGEIVSISNVFFDNTELYRAQEALGKSQEQFKNIFNHSQQAIIIVDLDGKTPLDCNRAAIRMFGCADKNQLLQSSLDQFLPPTQLNKEDSIVFEAKIHQAVLSAGITKNRVKRLRADGEEFVADITYVLDSAEGYKRMIYFLTDITQEYHAGEMLKLKNAELEQYISSNIQLEQFAHIASHDLKSPLRTISSFTGLLKQKIGDGLRDNEREYLNYIEQGTNQMSNLINDLLAYSKVNSQELDFKKVELDSMVRSVLKDLSFSIEESGAVIELQGLEAEIVADPLKLRRVFQNLISNALKFSKPDAHPHIHISLDNTHRGHWLVRVVDSGIGIDSKFHSSIFERFTHLHSNDRYEGTGMGLAICKKTIEQHGGSITVESELGQGSSFIFTISKALQASR